jgi:hypothetical protein
MYGGPPEALTCLWVLVVVTFVAEATGTARVIVADQIFPGIFSTIDYKTAKYTGKPKKKVAKKKK